MVVISDGKLRESSLKALGRDRNWLNKQLSKHGCPDLRQVFLLLTNGEEQFYLAPMDGRDSK